MTANRWLLAFLLTLFVPQTLAGEEPDETKASLPQIGDMRVSGQAQIWSVFSSGVNGPGGEPVEDRWDLYLRRARLGLSGRIGESVGYAVTFAYDNVGKNAFTIAPGAPQDRDNTEFKVWDAFFTWAAEPTWANVTLGYFRPQVGRESITSAVQVNSFSKALPNTYPRLHLLDAGPGRATGINVGGLYHPGRWGLHYNVGIFDADHAELNGLPAGTTWSPLLAGRVSVTVGDPEMERYGLAYRTNYFGARNGATISVNHARQGGTDVFERNTLTGVDLLANYGPWNLSAEIDRMQRDTGTNSYANRVSSVRCGRNFPLENGRVLEPFLMFSEFDADREAPDDAPESRKMRQAGLNWYLDKNRIKLNLAYTWQDGDRDPGDFAGLGLQFLY